MEHAPLRPVPARPAGPVDPETALHEVGGWLPTLPPPAARALALVVLAERPRSEVAATLEVSEPELAELLASARKELRQTIVVLGGSGWCERAEGLISDRLDGVLAERNVRRLDVHLRNCSRCVEHERRLVQATDALIGGVGGFARGPAPAGEKRPLMEATPADDSGQEDGAPSGSAGAQEADAPKATPAEAQGADAPTATPAAAQRADASTAAPAEAQGPDAPTATAEGAEAPTAAPAAAQRAEAPTATPAARPEPATDEIAAAAEVLVTKRTRGQIAAAIAWNSLIAIAILLTLATIALTIAGILGAQL
jgi:trimeric autotransporter adhesin